ncbi:hypothetical protein D3C85_1304520 [compost metagenome]
MGEGRQVEDRHAADAEDHVAIEDGAQVLILNRLVGLDGDAGLLGSVDVADRAGGEDDPVQFADVFRAAHGGGGHQASPVGQTQGQINGDPGLEIRIEFDAAGVQDRAVGRHHFSVAGRGRDAALQVIGDFFGADAVVARAGVDAILGRSAGGHDVAFTAGGVGVHIEAAGRQAVGAGRVRGRLGRGCGDRGRRGRAGVLGHGRQGGHAGDQGRSSQEPDA